MRVFIDARDSMCVIVTNLPYNCIHYVITQVLHNILCVYVRQCICEIMY